ncbi:hypothetical protein SAMN05216276_106227 [Streptosporangium subroseum]|uniref:Uncharacterized protein n=1 Tax=Streptosporangium subroseum TaxID=106412 RepID=A0A239NLT3_9ACTN|nr:hypothetical protein SAMN05216276_106227 [Streptosporangium subroseum]
MSTAEQPHRVAGAARNALRDTEGSAPGGDTDMRRLFRTRTWLGRRPSQVPHTAGTAHHLTGKGKSPETTH